MVLNTFDSFKYTESGEFGAEINLVLIFLRPCIWKKQSKKSGMSRHKKLG